MWERSTRSHGTRIRACWRAVRKMLVERAEDSLDPHVESCRLFRHFRAVMGYQVRRVRPSAVLSHVQADSSPHRSQNRAPLQILEGARDSITSIRIHDHLISTGSVDGFVRTYDLRMGQLQADFFDRGPCTPFRFSSSKACRLCHAGRRWTNEDADYVLAMQNPSPRSPSPSTPRSSSSRPSTRPTACSTCNTAPSSSPSRATRARAIGARAASGGRRRRSCVVTRRAKCGRGISKL